MAENRIDSDVTSSPRVIFIRWWVSLDGILMAKQYTIANKAATLGMWMRNISPTDIERNCAPCGNPTRDAQYRWANKGEVTDGVPWHELKKHGDAGMSHLAVSVGGELASTIDAAGNLALTDRLMKDISGYYDSIKRRLDFGGEGDVTVQDLERLVNIWTRVQNHAVEKRLFANWLIQRVLEEARSLLTDDLFAALTLRLASLDSEIVRRLSKDERATLGAREMLPGQQA
jgi:hypothetical protein